MSAASPLTFQLLVVRRLADPALSPADRRGFERQARALLRRGVSPVTSAARGA
jgi:hypothetical protein